jgi:hypothetical protein
MEADPADLASITSSAKGSTFPPNLVINITLSGSIHVVLDSAGPKYHVAPVVSHLLKQTVLHS